MQSLKSIELAFFSYAHEDAQFALSLAKDLRAGGVGVWMDRLDIKPGQQWDRAVEDALARCSQLLVILSPSAVKSTNVMDEVSYALGKGKPVLPVICRDCEIPFRLARLQYVDLTLNYQEGLDRLRETLGCIALTSDDHGGTQQVNLPSQAAPGDATYTGEDLQEPSRLHPHMPRLLGPVFPFTILRHILTRNGHHQGRSRLYIENVFAFSRWPDFFDYYIRDLSQQKGWPGNVGSNETQLTKADS